MRHVGSLLLALVLAPLAWVLTGVGLFRYSDVRVQFDDGVRVELLLGLLALLAAGALYAVLVLARLSPIGPALAGAAYLGAAVWYGVAPRSFLDLFPYEVGGVDLGLPIPAAGVSAVLAVPLLATLMSPRRWRRYDRPPAARAGAYPTPPGAQYGPPGSPYGPPPGYPTPTPAGVGAPAGGLGMSSPVPTPEPAPAYGPPAATAFPAARYQPTGSPAAPTTAFPQVPAAATPQSPPPPPVSAPPTPAPPASPKLDAGEPTTTVLASGARGGGSAGSAGRDGAEDDQPTRRLDSEATQLVKGPPPPDAYPRPAWSAPTPPPITPPKPGGDVDN